MRLGESNLARIAKIEVPIAESEVEGEMLCYEYGLARISAARLLANRLDYEARETLLNLGEKLNL